MDNYQLSNQLSIIHYQLSIILNINKIMALTRFLKAKEVPAQTGPFLNPLEPEVKKFSIEELDLLRAQNPCKIEIRYVKLKDGNNTMQEGFIMVGINSDEKVTGAALPCPHWCVPPKDAPEAFTISEAINYVLTR
jgi:hypothetical protein